MKYLFLAKSAADPATRYRVDPIVSALVERGDQVDVIYEATASAQLAVVISAPRYDLIFVQRKLFSSLVLRLIGARAAAMVFDCDDAIFLKSNGKPSRTRGGRFAAAVSAADLVLCGNSYLCEAVSQRGGQAELVPTSVDVSRYGVSGKVADVSLVWIGSSSTSRYLNQFRDTLEAIGKAYPHLMLRIVSDFELELEHLRVECIPWSAETETRELAASHIGIAPMTEDPWTRGKCALKVIQYMAAGLPVISSDVGANRDVIVDGVTGILADTTDDWVWAVGQLVDSAASRQHMGAEGQRVAKASYSMEATVGQVIQLLDGLTAQ